MITVVKLCRICRSKKIQPFLNLGSMPLPNGFLKEDEVSVSQPLFPLEIGFCFTCSLVQLTTVVDPEIMFRNYVYIPSTSQTRMDNFREIVNEALAFSPPSPTAFAVDIGSNDGSLLLEFKKRNIRPLGVDSAENLALISSLKGMEVLNDYFSQKVAERIVRNYGYVDYVAATNVVGHINDLHNFFEAIRCLLGKSGIFICEFPYLVDLLEKNYFDTIYQEHLSYFAIRRLKKIIEEHQLKVARAKRTTIDGGALRLIIVPVGSSQKEDNKSLVKLLALEKERALDSFETYKKFAKRVEKLRSKIRALLKKLKENGKTIAGYGASARGNILMNYCKIGRKEIDFILDATPYKQGLYTPGTRIKIFPEEELLIR